jgi:ADP-ribosylglycohydrolase
MPPTPVPGCYWVLPGRLLFGEFPGSQSRAEAMERLRSFLAAGVTCFVDLTEPQECPSYEGLLPFSTPSGRRVEYLRQSIPDHAVPQDRAVMERILQLVNDALAAGHVVYVHCRAGIGRSATVAGCWLAEQRGDTELALADLQDLWRQAAQSSRWTKVPETEAQEKFVRGWLDGLTTTTSRQSATVQPLASRAERIRGAWLGLAVGDALGSGRTSRRKGPLSYTQPTALALCLADSLLEKGRCDARDQIERYVRWQREGLRSSGGEPGRPTPDVARALGVYLWRGLPMAGSHDPQDRTSASLPRVVAAATFASRDPAAAIALAGECSRTTHQAPIVIDACRYFAALLLDAVRGRPREQVLGALPEPAPDCWQAKPLRSEVLAQIADDAKTRDGPQSRDTAADVLEALANTRSAVRAARDFEAAVRLAVSAGSDPALDGALAGAVFGALHGAPAIPRERETALRGLAQVRDVADRMSARDERVGD